MKKDDERSTHKFHQKMDITYYDHLKDIYYGRVALIRGLEGILGKEQTHDIIRKFYTRQAVESCTERMEKEKNPPKNLDDVREFFKKLLDNPFSKQAQTETYPDSEQGTLRICTTECLWASVLKDLDATDLGYIMFCQTDFPTAEIFHPKLRLERKKTLMQGDDCCDFIYHWEE